MDFVLVRGRIGQLRGPVFQILGVNCITSIWHHDWWESS